MFKASPQEQLAAAEDINGWLASGKLKPHIGRILPLAQAAEAHRLQEANTIHKAGTLSGKSCSSRNSPFKKCPPGIFNLAKGRAKLRPARKMTTCVVILGSHPCDRTAS